MAEATDWSYYHRMDEQFHQLVGTASCLDSAVEAYHETLAELYDYFIPYPIEKLHKSNQDHIALVAALRAGKVEEAVEVSRKHVTSCTERCLWDWPRGQLKRCLAMTCPLAVLKS